MMNPYPGLPEEVLAVIRSAILCEFATLTQAGAALDTPTYCFTGLDGRSVDVATGLAYPTKAERARHNPKVGLLLEGAAGTPIVSIAAIAAVRDADIQQNATRYIAETIAYEKVRAQEVPWSQRRAALWYWSRIFVLCTPSRIRWWPNAAQTDAAPRCWDAPQNFAFPKSDPAPAAPPSHSASWPVREWKARAQEMLEKRITPHLTLVDDDGFPLPFRCRAARLLSDGFAVDVPAGAPWTLQGTGSLCFAGLATFIGNVQTTQSEARFIVERIMPDLPLVQDPKETFAPNATTRSTLMSRLEHELARRGQPLPSIPLEPPPATAGSLERAQLLARMIEEMALRAKTDQATSTQA